jgi:hypothetical protein
MKSFYKCPACDAPFRVAIESTEGIVRECATSLFCQNARCPSAASRVGGKGRTEADAYKALCKAVDTEDEK